MQIHRVIDECVGDETNSGIILMMDAAGIAASETEPSSLNANQRQKKDRIAYATIDRLALKRARLPLQLVPIDDNNSATEKKEKTNGEKRVHGSRKSSPKRPSFKMRSGIPLSNNSSQWKSRGSRSSSRPPQASGSFENVSKELVSRLIIFETIIRNNSKITEDCESVKAEELLNQEVQSHPEARISGSENSSVIHSRLLRDSVVEAKKQEEEIDESSKAVKPDSRVTPENRGVDLSPRNVSEEENATSLSSVEANEEKEFLEPIETEVTSEKHFLDSSSTSTSTSSLTATKKKRHKAELSFAKNVLHCVPMSSQSKRSKKSVGSSKNRKNDPKSNLQSSRSFSREELRHSISLPLNFVHVASATNPKLLPNVQTKGRNGGKIIKHEEKCAELELIDNQGRRLDKNVYENKQSPDIDATNARKIDEENRLDGKDVDTKQAKVLGLEKSQGVPEVVKTSENEGRVEYASNTEQQDTTAPVYEAIAEFSISLEANSPNSSFLWGAGRRSAIFNADKTNKNTNSELDIEYPAAEKNTDFSSSDGNSSCDAYDDVGLSRDDTEFQEDHYDDVGFPSTDSKASSSDTIFEEMCGESNLELYDDVLPGPTGKSADLLCDNKSVHQNDELALNNCSNVEKDSKDLNLVEKEQRECRSPSIISNDYSSVEEGFDDFEGEEDDGLYDDVELPSQERVNSLYAGSTSGSQLGSLYNGKESEWEDLEEAAPALPLPKKNGTINSRLGDSLPTSGKKKCVQRWSRKVRRQKSKASRKNPSANRSAASRGTSAFSDTASDDSNYETLCSFPSDEFSSGCSDDEDSSINFSSPNADDSGLQNQMNGSSNEAPSRPVPPPPRESSLTETLGKRMKMLRRTWSITKGSLGRMRRRTSTTTEADASLEETGKYGNTEQTPNNDAKKYFSFKKHFKKSVTGLSTFYLDNDNNDTRLSRNNNCSKEEVYSDFSNNSWYTNTDYWKSSVNEQSQRNDVDHYSMLDEEPLYQFYAAAAARVAFESDSEGYEEVEDPTPSLSTADFAKPGHRTLWCQTPQVTNSALLQRLTSEERKMQEAKFEIFTSEASYLNSLRVLVDEFLNDQELVHEVLTSSEREKLFGLVPSVLIASERLLAELETAWREDVMLRNLPDILLNYAQRSSSTYVAYCSNQVSIDTTLKELRNKKGSKFVDTVKRIETHSACQSLPLHSFLMLPMQRVTRLPLLADAVLSKVPGDNKDERTSWECVLSQLSQVVMECNEGARAAGRLAEMETLERKLEYSSKVPPIVLRDRYLVRRGPVVQMLAKADAEYKLTFGKKQHKASLYLLLLTDYLLIAKQKSNANEETYTVIDTCKRSLVALEKVTEDSPFAGRHAMVLSLLENYSGRHVEYILTCNNATERERWLDAISPPKPSLVGETLYETWDCPQVMALYPYAAAQPDELTLQPGDVINVLRKMTDGWHLGEKLLGGEQGWFPGNYAKEVASEHVRARNLRQRHRLLALSASVLQQRAKQTLRLY